MPLRIPAVILQYSKQSNASVTAKSDYNIPCHNKKEVEEEDIINIIRAQEQSLLPPGELPNIPGLSCGTETLLAIRTQTKVLLCAFVTVC